MESGCGGRRVSSRFRVWGRIVPAPSPLSLQKVQGLAFLAWTVSLLNNWPTLSHPKP